MLYNFFMSIYLITEAFYDVVYMAVLFLLLATISNIRFKLYKLITFSVLAGIIIFVLDLLELPNAGIDFIKLLTIATSIYVLFYPLPTKKFIFMLLIVFLFLILTWGFSYLLQLVLFTFVLLTKSSYVTYVVLKSVISLGLGVLICIFFILVYRKRGIENFVFDVNISIWNKVLRAKLFLDSGNMLYDNKTGLPIVILSKTFIEKVFNKGIDCKLCRNVEFSSVDKKVRKLPIVAIGKIYVKKKSEYVEYEIAVGVAEMTFGEFDGLLHSAVC